MKTEAFKSADILLPKKNFDKWAVIACDQFTSDISYWENTKKCAEGYPSALNIILPEIYLQDDNTAAISRINTTMKEYYEGDVFNLYKDALIYVERRQKNNMVRRGLIGAIDLEKYDYHKGSKSLIRATEETVPDRLPPRIAIRECACLELPHVMLLIDDPENKVIGNLSSSKDSFQKLYSFELMMGGGYIDGYLVNDESKALSISLLDSLADGDDPLLFAVGDGNHSLASAKECYLKNPTPENRFALVEIVNIYDESLVFEPIYRIIFGIDRTLVLEKMKEFFGEINIPGGHSFKMISENGEEQLTLPDSSALPVGTLQLFINSLCKSDPLVKVDYVHEVETVEKLCQNPNTVGFIFEGMKKSELFGAVIGDGALPRKTFSMGQGRDKRYYIETRKIK